MKSYANKTREEVQAEAAAEVKDRQDWISTYGLIFARRLADQVARFSDAHGVGYDVIVHDFELHMPGDADRTELPGLIGLAAPQKTQSGRTIYIWLSVWDLLRHRPINLWTLRSRFTSAPAGGNKHPRKSAAVLSSDSQSAVLSPDPNPDTDPGFTEV